MLRAVSTYRFLFLLWALLGLSSCMDYGPMDESDFEFGGGGVFVVNEGNFMFGNATLSYYDPDTKEVVNEAFSRSNGIALGDVAQSMTIHGGLAYVVVNRSGVIFVIDPASFKVARTIAGIPSPRYIHFLSDSKAYVTHLYSPKITILDPRSGTATGSVDARGHASTEQMVQWGRYVFTNCWSYDNKVLVIDSETDAVVDSITVGIQPSSLAIDRNGKLWVLSDGGYEGNPYGWEDPSLSKIDASTRQVERVFTLDRGSGARGLCMNGARDTLYYISRSVWRMGVGDDRLPLRPFISAGSTIFYSLGVDPSTSEVYLGDAIDYSQPGMVYRYNGMGELVNSFRAGINPGGFCFK